MIKSYVDEQSGIAFSYSDNELQSLFIVPNPNDGASRLVGRFKGSKDGEEAESTLAWGNLPELTRAFNSVTSKSE